MNAYVPERMLRQVSTKKLSPVDVVMGDHWGEIVLGNPQRLSLLNYVFRQFEEFRNRGGATRLRRRPQAFVKVIKQGNRNSKASLGGHIRYLQKDGEVDIELSDLFFDVKLREEDLEAYLDFWESMGHSNGDYDFWHHIIVSYPPGTDEAAAKRAARAWATEMFSSGKYGDVYHWHSAFHTDTDHPHMHISVLKRGMENGEWLSIHREGEFNYQTFREIQVEVSALEGIEIEATSRYARGLTDRAVPDAEYRAAEREGRQPVAPSHTPMTALRAVASLALYSSQMTADAYVLRQNHPELAQDMRQLAATIMLGQEVKADPKSHPIISLEEAKKISELIMSRRNEILAGIREIDAEISTIPNGKERTRLEQDASKIKAETAKVIPDAVELAGHSEANREGYYKGVEAKDGIDESIKRDADGRLRELAKEVGIDPDKLVTRYDRTSPAPVALSEAWRKDELEDIQRNLTYREPAPQDPYEQLAQAAYDDLHRNALQTYRKAERELEDQAKRRKELHRIAKLIREGRSLDGFAEEEFRKTLKQALTTSELSDLERGNSKVFRHVTQNAEEQRALSRRYLDAEIKAADRARQVQLKLAIEQIDRVERTIAERAKEDARKDRGLDR